MTTVFRVAVRHVSGKKNLYDITLPGSEASFEGAIQAVRDQVPTAKVVLCQVCTDPSASAA